MRLVKRMKARNRRIVLEDLPIPPVNLERGEVAVKIERVLLTPLDFLSLEGYLDREFLGTLGYGRILEKASQDIPEQASIYPSSCSDFPPIGREGAGSEIYPYPAKQMKAPPRSLKFPELLFIYDLIAAEASLAEGQTLIVGGAGLQTFLLSKMLKDATLFGSKERPKALGQIPLISAENLPGSEWDTVIVNTVSFPLASYALRKTKWRNLILNPFFACLNPSIPFSGDSFTASVAFPEKKETNYKVPYEEMEKLAMESGLIEEISINEIESLEPKGYMSVLFREVGN